MKISIVIPNYNGQKLLENNLPKLIEVLDKFSKDIEIIISDDCSKDESIRVVEEFINKGHKIKLLVNDKNLGFAANVDRAVKSVSGEIIILLNTDVVPEEGFLAPLLERFKDPNVFAVGCLEKSLEPNGEIILRGRGLGQWKNGFLIHRRGEINKENTLWVSGGSGAFRTSIWRKLGGMVPLYSPFYWEDIDLSYRALKSGYKIYFEKRSKVVHEHERGVIKTEYSKKQVKTIAYRNQFIFSWLNLTDSDLILTHAIFIPYLLLKSLILGDLAFIYGFFGSFVLLPKIIIIKPLFGVLFNLLFYFMHILNQHLRHNIIFSNSCIIFYVACKQMIMKIAFFYCEHIRNRNLKF